MFKLYLFFAGVFNILIALVHFAAIFIGEKAYDFLDSPQFSEMLANGSFVPAFVTSFMGLFFLLVAWYSFSAAEFGPKLPQLFIVLSIIGWIYVVRGFAVFPFIYFYFTDSIYNNPKEIAFSLIALFLGRLLLLGRQHLLIVDLDKIKS